MSGIDELLNEQVLVFALAFTSLLIKCCLLAE